LRGVVSAVLAFDQQQRPATVGFSVCDTGVDAPCHDRLISSFYFFIKEMSKKNRNKWF
jgi:hypothetical protein